MRRRPTDGTTQPRLFASGPFTGFGPSLFRHADDPVVCERLQGCYHLITEEIEPLLQLALDRFGLRIKAPYRLRTLTVALQALGEGLHVRWAVDPEAVPDDVGAPPGVPDADGGPWGLYAALCQTLVTAMTEPIEPIEPEEAEDPHG